ncbi:hypothetical protein DE146DRAFT_651155 [Phaeosphaeria sp. MPI-PUGE-AT-0046c]|nr:hypothetical protein DE146DRAFT_651155 [Phaeosphaeria sp. MPI-PUGE-AT-0046c]
MLRFFFVAVAYLLAVAASAPAPTFSRLPTAQLRTIGPGSTLYVSSTQNPSKTGHIISLVIGTTLSSLAQSPLLLQGFEIVHVEGDAEVFCKANINHSSQGILVSSKDGMVMLDQDKGGVVQVTGLSCGFGSGGA